jgi:hypothetical protein
VQYTEGVRPAHSGATPTGGAFFDPGWELIAADHNGDQACYLGDYASEKVLERGESRIERRAALREPDCRKQKRQIWCHRPHLFGIYGTQGRKTDNSQQALWRFIAR